MGFTLNDAFMNAYARALASVPQVAHLKIIGYPCLSRSLTLDHTMSEHQKCMVRGASVNEENVAVTSFK